MLSFAAVDWIFGKVAYKLLTRMPHSTGELAKMNYQIESSVYDCYILGSSRAAHHYAPSVIADALGMSVYNAGCDGQGVSYADALLKSILDRHKPKIVILECGQIEIEKNWLEKMSVLKPYYVTHPKVFDLALMINGNTERVKCMSSLYRFNSKAFQIIKSYALSSEDKSYGYEPISANEQKVKGLSYKSNEKENFALDSTVEKVLEDLVKTCKDNNIKLVVFCSPVLYDYSDVSRGLSDLFRDLEVPFYDYSNDTSFIYHSELFGDFVHLNSTGADLYSRKVASDVLSH